MTDDPLDFHGFDPEHVEAAAKAAWANYRTIDTIDRYLALNCFDVDDDRVVAEGYRQRALAEWPETGLYPDADDFLRAAVAAMLSLVERGWRPA